MHPTTPLAIAKVFKPCWLVADGELVSDGEVHAPGTPLDRTARNRCRRFVCSLPPYLSRPTDGRGRADHPAKPAQRVLNPTRRSSQQRGIFASAVHIRDRR